VVGSSTIDVQRNVGTSETCFKAANLEVTAYVVERGLMLKPVAQLINIS
jgi:hypothetical protein